MLLLVCCQGQKWSDSQLKLDLLWRIAFESALSLLIQVSTPYMKMSQWISKMSTWGWKTYSWPSHCELKRDCKLHFWSPAQRHFQEVSPGVLDWQRKRVLHKSCDCSGIFIGRRELGHSLITQTSLDWTTASRTSTVTHLPWLFFFFHCIFQTHIHTHFFVNKMATMSWPTYCSA